MDILTIGEVLIDLTQTGKDARGIPQFAANPGGAPANLAVAAARLGAQTAFYATGDLPRSIREACRTPIQYREYLITDGLYRIWQKNRK